MTGEHRVPGYISAEDLARRDQAEKAARETEERRARVAYNRVLHAELAERLEIVKRNPNPPVNCVVEVHAARGGWIIGKPHTVVEARHNAFYLGGWTSYTNDIDDRGTAYHYAATEYGLLYYNYAGVYDRQAFGVGSVAEGLGKGYDPWERKLGHLITEKAFLDRQVLDLPGWDELLGRQ